MSSEQPPSGASQPPKRSASELSLEEAESADAAKKSKPGESPVPDASSTSSSSRSPSPTRKATRGVSHLLQTDAIHPMARPAEAPPPIPSSLDQPIYELRTVGVEREVGAGDVPPGYLLFSSDVPFHPMYNFLDSITEEDSDDLRSQSSASSQRASTSARSAEAATVEQVEARVQSVLLQKAQASSASSSENSSSEVGIVELSTPSSTEESRKPLEQQKGTNLEEAKDSHQPSRSESQRSSVRASSSASDEKASVIDKSESVARAHLIVQENPEGSTSEDSPTDPMELEAPRIGKMEDADREQTELLVNPNDQFSCFTPLEDGRISANTSISLNLDQSRDSLLDHSACSITRDEIHIPSIRAKMTDSAPKASTDSDEEELPDPPPNTFKSTTVENTRDNTTSSATPAAATLRSSTTTAATISHSPGENFAETVVTRTETASDVAASDTISPGSNAPAQETKRPIGSAQLAAVVYGYGEKSPLNWEKSKLKTAAFGDSTDKSRVPRSPEEADKENRKGLPGAGQAPHLRSAYVNTSYTSAFVPQPPTHSHQRDPSAESFQGARSRYDRSPISSRGFGMTDPPPPSEAPPPPPGQRSFTDDDLMSERNRSRSTIRDIPIQRAPTNTFGASYASSAMPVSTTSALPQHGATSTGWTTTRYDPITGAPQQEEYYRREVMTRTLITRSTEALSAPPPLSRSSPVDQLRQLPDPRDEITEEFLYKYSRNIEEEERRIRESQESRQKEEQERRRRIDEQKRLFEQQEAERLERLRREREQIEKQFENEMLRREAEEKERIERDRYLRQQDELRRRSEWERLEDERRKLDEAELEKRKRLEEMEKERLRREKERLEEIERQRLEAERKRFEEQEKQRIERERIERERIEIERLEIERIERIKREQREKEEREKELRRQEAERLEKERLEAERLERERQELLRREQMLLMQAQREAEERERERRAEELKERQRREQEARDRQLLEQAKIEARNREMARRQKEAEEARRIEELRREQERLEFERLDALRREQERKEEERREQELLEAARKNRERREQERLEEEARERARREEEQRAQMERERQRIEAQERERLRNLEEERERQRLGELEAARRDRDRLRNLEQQREHERMQLERRAKELEELEQMHHQRREQERLEEERRLAELEAVERRKAEQREKERQEAAQREDQRQRDDRKSRDHLEEVAREREKKEQWALEKLRLLREHEELEKKRQALTSKETLERLTRKPYYSRENLSTIGLGQPDVTTKVERQVIERVDRTLWSSDDRYPNTTATQTYYSHSALPPGGGNLSSQHDTHDDLLGGGGPQRERLFSHNNNASQDDDPLRRGSGNRTSKYKASIQKAKRDYFASDAAPTSYDPFAPSDRLLRKSNDDLSAPSRYRSDYRGPLLERFNEAGLHSHAPRQQDFDSAPPAYTSAYVRPTETTTSPYDQRPEEDVLRSRSVLDYSSTTRQSRRDIAEAGGSSQHSRSKSDDHLIDKRLREDAAPPENELRKTADGLGYAPPPPEPTMILSEHESRFRKSMDKLHSITPEWYRDHIARPAPPPLPTDTSQATDHRSSGYASRPYSRQQYEWSPPAPQPSYERQRHSSGSALVNRPGDLGSPVGGISFPPGMFDRYKNEIEDLRRSRSSLHQADVAGSPTIESKYSKEFSREEYSKRDVRTFLGSDKLQPGYTVSTVPADWNLGLPRERNSRVIEVADTFIGKHEPQANKYGGRVTIEEVLDAIFQETNPSVIPADPNVHDASPQPPPNIDGPGIYTTNHSLMDRVIQQPYLAEQLLKNEPLLVRCTNCHKTRGISEARIYYVSCKHCYTYYCSKRCRAEDWDRHKDRCSFARINTLCKEVIMKVRRDPETQYHMSKVARDGYRREGRGSVNIRFVSAHSAQMYLEKGWKALLHTEDPNQLLFYYPIQALVDQRKEPSLIQLCRKYNPQDKFILSVSIIADIEQCPETPPPEPIISDHRYAPINKPFRPAIHHHYQQPHDRFGALVPTDI